MELDRRSDTSPQIRDEVRNTLAARRELGPELDDELIESFAQRIRSVVAEEVSRQVGARSSESKQLLDWRKEMYAITLGIGFLMMVIGAFAAELVGVIVVCVMLVLVSLAWTIRGK